MSSYIDLRKPKFSYLLGLLQTDGSYVQQSRNRGRITLELKRDDRELLEKLQGIIPVYSSIVDRSKNTNFKDNYESSVLSFYDKNIRDELEELGLVSGKKSGIIKPPNVNFVVIDYVRGLIDGDGSLGLTSQDIPFVSFTTNSSYIAEFYLNFLNELLSKDKTTSRNKRDNVFNIGVYKEDAQKLVTKLYYSDCICLDRKYNLSERIKKWERPDNMIKVSRKSWDEEQDTYIRNHSIKQSMRKLDRTDNSIKSRLRRLKIQDKQDKQDK